MDDKCPIDLGQTRITELLGKKNLPPKLFKDGDSQNYYLTHYEGMGEHFAVELSDRTARLIEGMLENGILCNSEQMIHVREMIRVKKEDGSIKEVGTNYHRAGFAIERSSKGAAGISKKAQMSPSMTDEESRDSSLEN